MQFKNLFTEMQYYKNLKAAKALPNDSDKIESLISISDQFLKLEDTFEAIEALNEALESAKVMSDDGKSQVLIKISDQFLKLDNTVKALEVANAIPVDHLRSKAQGGILFKFLYLIEQGDIDKALESAKALPDGGYVKSAILGRISNQFLKEGDIIKATEVLNKVLELAKIMPDSGDLVRISDQFLELGDPAKAKEILNEALEIAKTITDAYRKIKALVEISNKFSKGRDTAKALEVLNEALESAKSITVSYQKSEVLIRMAKQFSKLDTVKAIEVLSEALKITIADDDSESLILISHQFLKLGDTVKALKAANVISDAEDHYDFIQYFAPDVLELLPSH